MATRTAEDRRIGGETRAQKRPTMNVNPLSLKERWQYEARIKELEERIQVLEMSTVDTQKSERTAEHALALYGDSKDVKGLATRLQVMLPNAEEIGTLGVTLMAQIAIMHGLDPLPGSDHIYAWKQFDKKTGTKVLKTVIGYKGLLALARREVRFTYESRPMTDEEREEHCVAHDGYGYVTVLYELDKAWECKQLGIPYPPVIGTATWKPGDEVPKSRSAAWVCKKNSLKDALRQITKTGQRLSNALDEAFAQLGLSAAVEEGGGSWRVELPEDEEELKSELIEAGMIVDGESHESETCERCGSDELDPGSPFGNFCAACSRALADEQAAADS